MSLPCSPPPIPKTWGVVVTDWRRLTSSNPKAKAVIACSGGADSVALLLSVLAHTRNLVVAHVVHDLRPRSESLEDRDFVRDLAMLQAYLSGETTVVHGADSRIGWLDQVDYSKVPVEVAAMPRARRP